MATAVLADRDIPKTYRSLVLTRQIWFAARSALPLSADIPERHSRPERGAGITAAEDGSCVIADGEQARDRVSPDIQHPRLRVSDQAVTGRDVACPPKLNERRRKAKPIIFVQWNR